VINAMIPVTSSIPPQPQIAVNPLPTIEDRMKLLTPEGVKGLSTSALVNLVKRLESSGQLSDGNNSKCTSNSRHHMSSSSSLSPSSSSQLHLLSPVASSPRTPFETPNVDHHNMSSICADTTLVKLLQRKPSSTSYHASRLKPDHIEPIATTAGTLASNLHQLEDAFDSDATESSSGGESCDELDDFNNTDALRRHSSSSTSTPFTPS